MRTQLPQRPPRPHSAAWLCGAALLLAWFFSAPPAFADSCAEAYEREDYKAAYQLCLPLAEQDDVWAQSALGLMYEYGKGVAENDAEAARWYRKAAEQGLAEAQFTLGLMYSQGVGVAKNDVEAVRWRRKAAEQGHAGAQFALGFMYENGYGVEIDWVRAYKWYNLAAAQGDEEAAENRSSLERRMSWAQIAEAQRLSAEE